MKNTPIVAVQPGLGRIKLIHYDKGDLITPLVNDILATGLSGTTCVMTHKNDEALQVTGLLLKTGMPAKLIQSNEDFNLFNLLEICFFMRELKFDAGMVNIDDEDWAKAKVALASEFRDSSKLEICNNIIHDDGSLGIGGTYNACG